MAVSKADGTHCSTCFKIKKKSLQQADWQGTKWYYLVRLADFLTFCGIAWPFIFLLPCSSLRSFIICLFLIPRFEIQNGNTLRLFRVKQQDEGTYTCTSENSVGKTEASATLQVHGKKHIMHTACEHTHSHLGMHKKALIHKITYSHMATASYQNPFPICPPMLCDILSVCLCESLSSGAARSLC